MSFHDRPRAGTAEFFTLLWVLLLHLAVPGDPALAQDRDADFDPHPLRPPDVSTPRATLNSFLTDAQRAIGDLLSGEFDADTRRAYVRAAETFDFSDTPDGASWSVRDRTMVYLLEILERIELPPEDQIPGDAEVADGTVTRWTIPNTRITIARMEEGPKAGAYLFSADTVQQLDRLYRHAKHLPYKPGSEGDASKALLLLMQEDRVARRVRNRLRGVDFSNPRSTLLTFLDSVNRAYALATETDAALTATPRP